MIRAVIIDDTEKARIALKSDLKTYCPEVKVVAEASGVEEGIEILETYYPDLIFLDIKMGDGTGFDLIEKIRENINISFRIIFTTAHDEFAIKAFKYSALDYLLKPVDPDDLVNALKKYKETNSGDFKANIDILLNKMGKSSNGSQKIALNSSEKLQIVDIDDIIRCESTGNYTIFYLSNQTKIIVTRTLKEFDELLAEYNFIRVHNSHLINPKHVKEFIKIESYALMSDGSQVPVSVRKKEQLLKHFGI